MKGKNRYTKIFIFLLCIAMLLIIVGVYLAFFKSDYDNQYKNDNQNETVEQYTLREDGSIYFSDANLEKALKKIMKLDKIYPDDALKIDHLLLFSKKIKSLTGIEFFKNLKCLYLDDNEIVNISNLKELANLKILSLGENGITDVTDLSSMEWLEHVYLSGNRITDISPLLNLKKLVRMPTVENNTITNLELFEPNLKLYYNNRKNNFYEILIEDEENNEITIKTAKDYAEDSMVECNDNEDYITCSARLEYEEDKTTIDTYKKAMVVANDFVKNNINDNMSDLEKEMTIIKYIASQVSYTLIDERDDFSYTHDYYYPLVLHVGQCTNYAQAFDILGTLSGLEVESAYSGLVHEWNLAKIDGVYYHVDITWGDSDDKEFNYDYVNLSTDTMNELHGKDTKFIPLFYQTDISKTDMSNDIKLRYIS